MPHVDLTRQLSAAIHDRRLVTAALALHQNRLHDAEPLLKQHLKQHPFDVTAIRMLAELAARIGRMRDSETLLRRALELAPNFDVARVNLATVLYRTNRPAEALHELARLDTDSDDDNPNLRAAVLNRMGEFEQAIALYEETLQGAQAGHPKVWMSYGHVLKTVGRAADGVAAYRRAIALQPGFGEAWWSLANLKTVRLDAADIRAMEAALAAGADGEDRFHLEFALGKALEDMGEAPRAFAHYRDGNAHRRALIQYDPAETRERVDRAIATFDSDFFAARGGWGCPSDAPIFILGLPRSGSTLLEQILASHSAVEGVTELPDIPELWRGLGERPHEAVAALTADEARALGEDYLARVAPQRKTERPRFIDKLPNNWLLVGFIRLILPNARIIDARRHPLSCGWANFRQHFARGQHFAYDLADLGAYYADYVRLMRHFDRTCPGAVHRVIYEQMVEDTDARIRALLEAVGLPFEAACLQFHKTDRPVRTPSSEQVRSPIYRTGTENWQAFAEWLGPLREALGDMVDTYAA